MKSYSTHARRLLGPIQINRVIVKAPPQAVTRLWGFDPVKPLLEVKGTDEWVPNWESGPIVLDEHWFCGFVTEPPDAVVNIQTLYTPFE